MKTILTSLVLAILFFLLLFCTRCGKSAHPEARVLLIGLDGLEIDVMKPLLEKGELPNLAGLIDRGVFGYLRTFEPTQSPVIWTSIATGKAPPDHWISGFIDPSTHGPFTSNARKGRALWNIVSEYGLACNVTGYWITWPAEEINGYMISQVATKAQKNVVWKGMFYKDTANATWPPSFIDEIWPVVEPFQSPEFLNREALPRIYGGMEGLDASMDVKQLISQSNWSVTGDFVYSEAAKYLLDKHPGDLDIVYLGGTDVLAHRFWRYMDPEPFKYSIMPKYVNSFGDTILNYYKLADEMVGELVKRVPENTRIFIISDHGMHAEFVEERTLLSAHHMDAPPGVIIAAGQGIRKGQGVDAFLAGNQPDTLGTVFDVTPTLLYLLDIPVGRNMKQGMVMKKVVEESLLAAKPVRHVDSHDTDFRHPTSSETSENDGAFIEKMAELGYLDGVQDSAETLPRMGEGKKKK